jgi:putative tricarboxylic transport membrane protein
MSIGLLIGALRKRNKIEVKFNRTLLINLGKFLGLLIVYILIIVPLGFIIATALFTFSMIWLLGGTRKQALVYALPISLLTYLLFSYLLKVPLPKGLLQFI